MKFEISVVFAFHTNSDEASIRLAGKKKGKKKGK